MKKIICLIFITVILSSCIITQDTDKYRYNDFLVQYKLNKNSSLGIIGAIYGGRIYYFSQESGTRGIHSMNPDGSDVRLEVETKDIQKLQIADKNLYYLDLERISYGASGSRWGNRCYSLKRINLENGESEHYAMIENTIKEIMEENIEGSYRGLWDFYYLGEGIFLVSRIDTLIPTGRFGLESDQMDSEGNILSREGQYDIKFDEERLVLSLYKLHDNHYLITDWGRREPESIRHSEHFAIYNTLTSDSFAVRDKVLRAYISPGIYYIKDGNFIIGAQNHIAEYKLSNESILNKYTIEKAKTLVLFDKKYILGRFKNKEAVYKFDGEKFTAEKLFDNKKGHIIDICDDYYIVLNKNKLYKKTLSGKKIWKIKLGKNYIKDEVKVEIAGDWLFIKSFDLKEEKSTLEEKINLKTGERVDTKKE